MAKRDVRIGEWEKKKIVTYRRD